MDGEGLKGQRERKSGELDCEIGKVRSKNIEEGEKGEGKEKGDRGGGD